MKDRRKLWRAPDNLAEDWKTLAKSLIIRDEFSYAAYLRAEGIICRVIGDNEG